MRGQNHFSSSASLPVHQSWCLSIFYALERRLTFLNLFKNLLASLAPWLEQVIGHVPDFRRERKCHDPSLPENSCPAGICWCTFASWCCEHTHLPRCGCKGCTCDPAEFTHEDIYLTVMITESQVGSGNWMVLQKQGKTKQNRKIFILNDQEGIKSSSDLFGALNSFQPQEVNELTAKLPASSVTN